MEMGDSQANLPKGKCREIIDRKEPKRYDKSSNEKDLRKLKAKITENHQKLKEKGKSVSLTNIFSKYKVDFKEVIKRRPKSYCANANVELTSFHRLEDNINNTFLSFSKDFCRTTALPGITSDLDKVKEDCELGG